MKVHSLLVSLRLLLTLLLPAILATKSLQVSPALTTPGGKVVSNLAKNIHMTDIKSKSNHILVVSGLGH